MGWIDINNALPEPGKYIWVSFSNFSVSCVGRYETYENGECLI